MITFMALSCSQPNQDQSTENPTPETEAVAVSHKKTEVINSTPEMDMYPTLSTYIESLKSGMEAIPDER
ncbi:MAG: hypothetical protein HC880_20605, partial [Bacteroidia bacterium]|nr:hypothetical protein [Bacteroidia bacterium]